MLLSRTKCTALRCMLRARHLNTATAYRPHTIPHHDSPAREAYPKIPHHTSATPASTALPASSSTSNATIVHSPPTIQVPHPTPKTTTTTTTTTTKSTLSKPRRPRKQVLTLTPDALCRLREIQSMDGKMIKVSVVAKGCAGGAYKLEYVDNAGRFDEIVEQEDVKVLVDSKSLMKIIGSEMDFEDDVLSSRFTFRNPNVVSTCGCEESFATKEDEERLLGAGQKF